MDELRLRLERFAGPLDLLLFLVGRQEVDVFDVDLVEVCRQYEDYVGRMLPTLALEEAADYLAMAARLVRIKARLLDGRGPSDEDDLIDPREELVAELCAYRLTKARALHLLKRRLVFSKRHPPGAARRDAAEFDLSELSALDLALAYARLAADAERLDVYEVRFDHRTVEEFLEEMMRLLVERVRLRELARGERALVVGYFLAVLEGVRRGLLETLQAGHYGPLWISRRRRPETVRADSAATGAAG